MLVIATIINEEYLPLYQEWYSYVRKNTDLPVYILFTDSDLPNEPGNDQDIKTGKLVWQKVRTSVPFSVSSPERVAAYKLLLFDELPSQIEHILFLDVDTLVIKPLTEVDQWLAQSNTGSIVGCLDRFIGYKERLAEEMKIIDGNFQLVYLSDQLMKYINTGVFLVARKHFQQRFQLALQTWIRLYQLSGKHPSILDQNIFNYHLQKFDWPLCVIHARYNCLRTDNPQLINGQLWIDGESVVIYHLNGGAWNTKLERRTKIIENLHQHSRS